MRVFSTLLVSLVGKAAFYRRFPFIDKIVEVDAFSRFPEIENRFTRKTSFSPSRIVRCISWSRGNKKITVPYSEIKKVLDWEEDRGLQRKWLVAAAINVPEEYKETPTSFPLS